MRFDSCLLFTALLLGFLPSPSSSSGLRLRLLGFHPSSLLPPPTTIMMPQQQPQPQQWGMMAPAPPQQPQQQQYPPPSQYPQQQQQQQQTPPMWNQQPSQVPPPQLMQMQQQQLPHQQYHHHQQYHQPLVPAAPASSDEIRTLWIGDLVYWVDENYLSSCFASTGEVVSVKVIRNKQTGQSEGYGFIEFATRATAERVLQTFNGQFMPSTEQKFRLNWATLGAGEKRDDAADHPIFVGDLAADVTDYMLEETFRAHYTSVKGAKVVIDRSTGRSKGYGFVRFGDVMEQNRAMTEMNGIFCSTRPMRIGPAATKKSMGAQQQQYPPKTSYQSNQATSENDPNNTTIFVGGLDSNVTDDHLRQVFSQHGELVHVKIPVGKRCGFVQFAHRASAEEALQALNGTLLGGQNIRLSWGRSPNKQFQQQQDPNQWNNSYYGYGQGYESYGYAAAQQPQDPNMYAYGGYPGYGNYQQQQ